MVFHTIIDMVYLSQIADGKKQIVHSICIVSVKVLTDSTEEIHNFFLSMLHLHNYVDFSLIALQNIFELYFRLDNRDSGL